MSSEIDERTLREVYLPPFEAVVKRAGTWALMTSYNRLNGTYTSEHPWLLTEVLRGDWGFDGARDVRLVRLALDRADRQRRARPRDARARRATAAPSSSPPCRPARSPPPPSATARSPSCA